MAAVELSGLSKRYLSPEAPPALDRLDLTVGDGELLVLVGPSGCGKSTALRLVAGLETPSAGAITLDGRSLVGVPPQDRDVAMVFQGYALYPHLTVFENMAFPLRMRGLKAAARRTRVARIAAMVGLADKLDRRPSDLSGGERQRVAMGRAMVREPAVFLFDEPLSNLDAKLRAELRVELAGLVRALRTTALYVTHDQAEAMTMGDRVAVLQGGRLQQVASPRVLYTSPANAFVAGFVGTPPMNLATVSVEAGRARSEGIDLPLPASAASRARVTVGVRPEHLRFDGAGAGRLDARVYMREPLGPETVVHLSVGDGGAPGSSSSSSSSWRARVEGFGGPPVGAELTLSVDPNHIHLFDADDGVSLPS
ncbi:MAG: ABC transporter ATP-binding protein [Myxococcota bacterium]